MINVNTRKLYLPSEYLFKILELNSTFSYYIYLLVFLLTIICSCCRNPPQKKKNTLISSCAYFIGFFFLQIFNFKSKKIVFVVLMNTKPYSGRDPRPKIYRQVCKKRKIKLRNYRHRAHIIILRTLCDFENVEPYIVIENSPAAAQYNNNDNILTIAYIYLQVRVVNTKRFVLKIIYSPHERFSRRLFTQVSVLGFRIFFIILLYYTNYPLGIIYYIVFLYQTGSPYNATARVQQCVYLYTVIIIHIYIFQPECVRRFFFFFSIV